MKRMMVLLLGLVLVLGFALVACGDEATTEEDAGETTETTAAATATTTTEEASMAVDWTEAADYEGTEATFSGEIVAVDNKFTEKGVLKILVRMGGLQTESHLNVVVELNEDGSIPVEGLTEETLNGFVGKTIEITGVPVVNSFDIGAYDIFLTDVNQVKVVD